MILLLNYYNICHFLWKRYLYLFGVFTFTLNILVGISSLNICIMFIFMYPTYYQLILMYHTCINDNIFIQWIYLSRQCRYYKYWYNNDTIYSLSMSINISNVLFSPHYTFFLLFFVPGLSISVYVNIKSFHHHIWFHYEVSGR